MTSPTIDRATFAELEQTAGAEFAGELVDTFLAEAPAARPARHRSRLPARIRVRRTS